MKRTSFIGIFLALALAFPALAAPVHPVYRESKVLDICSLNEQRDQRFQDFLRVSVKISVSGAAGSGTICHYDESTGTAYVISCGHLWSGNKEYDPASNKKAKVIVWYKDGPRLDEPKSYDADVLFWSNTRGYDVSLLKFKPDWSCSFAPISEGYALKPGMRLNSMGCDGGREVARYEVFIQETSGADITTKTNSPRPGRSGGGLLTDEGLLVGVCWGTSDIESGDGTGFFTPVKAVREVFASNGHSWLLTINWPATVIPVFDHQDPGRKYDRHYVPLPSPVR